MLQLFLKFKSLNLKFLVEKQYRLPMLNAIKLPKRDSGFDVLVRSTLLKEHNIETGIHYPVGLPFLNAYKYLNHKPNDFPITYDYTKKILSLPLFPNEADVAE